MLNAYKEAVAVWYTATEASIHAMNVGDTPNLCIDKCP